MSIDVNDGPLHYSSTSHFLVTSTNGTWVNSRKLGKGNMTVLHKGDTIALIFAKAPSSKGMNRTLFPYTFSSNFQWKYTTDAVQHLSYIYLPAQVESEAADELVCITFFCSLGLSILPRGEGYLYIHMMLWDVYILINRERLSSNMTSKSRLESKYELLYVVLVIGATRK